MIAGNTARDYERQMWGYINVLDVIQLVAPSEVPPEPEPSPEPEEEKGHDYPRLTLAGHLRL